MFELEFERIGQPTARHQYETTDLILGRSVNAQLRVRSPRVARRHLRIREHDGVLLAEDLQSTNGTRVDGIRIADATEIELGSVVRVPDCTVTVTAFAPIISRDFEMMERPFLDLLARDPDDDDAREVYCDALEERGEHLRAEWLRTELAVRRGERRIENLYVLTDKLACAPAWLARVSRG